MDTSSSAAFRDASRIFADTAASVPGDAWDAAGLGQWSIRELAAHANRAHTTIVEYVESPRPPEPKDSAYFAEAAIAARARADAPVSAATPPAPSSRRPKPRSAS